MEVLLFLKERTRFIRQHYEVASAPFFEIKRKIEAKEEPYEPPYSEDPEPPFLEEWFEADTSLELLGTMCISVLSESLKLYFQTWEQELGIKCRPSLKDIFGNQGFVHGYKLCFGQVLKTDWIDCPANFAIIEQIVLARNSAQHPGAISDMGTCHSDKAQEKYPKPFFVSEYEKRIIEAENVTGGFWINPVLYVTREALLDAVQQVEMLGEWMEEKLFAVKLGRYRNSEEGN